jgi:hypothetical protein
VDVVVLPTKPLSPESQGPSLNVSEQICDLSPRAADGSPAPFHSSVAGFAMDGKRRDVDGMGRALLHHAGPSVDSELLPDQRRDGYQANFTTTHGPVLARRSATRTRETWLSKVLSGKIKLPKKWSILPTKLVKIIVLHRTLVIRIQHRLQLDHVVYEGITRWEAGPISEEEDLSALFAPMGG